MFLRLINSISKVDRILKTGILTGNFNNIAKVQPRPSEFKFISHSSAHFSHEPTNVSVKPLRPNWDNNGGSVKTEGEETQLKLASMTKSNCSTSWAKSAPKGPNQGSKSLRIIVKKNHYLIFHEHAETEKLAMIFFITTSITFAVLFWWRVIMNNYNERNEFCVYHLNWSRLAEMVAVNAESFQVQPVFAASIEFEFTMTLTLRLKFDILGFFKNVTPVTITFEMKAEPKKHEAPVVEKKTASDWGLLTKIREAMNFSFHVSLS